MTAESNLDTAKRYAAKVWEAEDPFDADVLDGFLSPRLVRHMSAVAEPLDKAGQIARLQGIKAAFPDVQIKSQDFVADGDVVVARAIFRGTHEGEFFGIPGTGARVTVHLIDMMRFEDGQVVEQWGGPDVADMLRQIGVVFTAP